MSLLPVGFGASGDDYEITDSLRFRDSASASLTRTPATAPTNAKKFTFSFWAKLGIVNNYGYIYENVETNNYTRLYTYTDGKIYFDLRISLSNYSVVPARVFRDPSAWYHIVWSVDTTQATASDRVSIYINGVKETSFTTANYPAQNGDTATFNTNQNNIGQANANLHHFDGYLTEFHGIDGQALTADDFGEYDANGTWKAKEYTGTYGTNGFYLPMKPTTQADGFNTVLYTGQGSNAPQSINGYGFTPDFVWIKSRVTGYGHALFDSIRGPNARLQSDTTGAEAVSATYLTSLDSDGFTLAADYGQNAPNEPYVAWGWDAGDNQPSTGHSSVSYKATGSPLKVSGLGFSPDLVWIKSRSNVGNHGIWDSVRGASNVLKPNVTDAESSISGVTSFDADGYTLGSSYNASGGNYIAWGWDAGDGDPVSNTDGSITSTVKASDATGFSIVSYTGTGANATVGHGLGAAPDMLIVKNRSGAYHWIVQHSSLGATKYLTLSTTDAVNTSSAPWNNTAPTSSVFSLGTSSLSNRNGNDYIAYCFSEVSGVSKFGSYTGTGSSGKAITGLGFRPGFLMIKETSSTGNWAIVDGTRSPFGEVAGDYSYANLTQAEGGGAAPLQFDSDGFTINSGDSDTNSSGQTYIYMAFKGSYSDHVSPLNDTGTIDSRVKANPDKGFSIVSYKSSGVVGDTVGHGLSAAPDLFFVKRRDTTGGWYTYHSANTAAPETDYLFLNTTAATADALSVWNDVAPTSDVLSLGVSVGVNGSGGEYIAYCWHSVAGYSKFGSYTGNGSTTGPVVTTGFRPAFVMIKSSTNSGTDWLILDGTRSPNNTRNKVLFPNLANAEAGTGYGDMDVSDTGFQIKTNGASSNASGATYIYMAFADTADARFNFDASGNKNNWLPNNINSSGESETTYDLMKDTPSLVDENAANFCTWNPLGTALATYTITLSEANLKASYYVPTNNARINGTLAASSGKWYFEFQATAGSPMVGFATTDGSAAYVYDGNAAVKRLYAPITGGNTSASYGATWNTTNTIGVALDLDAGTLTFYKDNVSQGVAYTGLSGTFTPTTGYQGGTTVTGLANFGQRPFAYTPPTGFKKLNTFNLPDSTIEDGSGQFNTVLYTGNGGAQAITGVGFTPSFIWAKSRSNAYDHLLVDAVRGGGFGLKSNTTGSELASGWVSSFDSDGFTYNVGGATPANANGATYVAWNWKANGSGVSNTDGSIPSTVSANTEAGFSIVSFTGNGATSSGVTIGHGLGATPDVVITKKRSGGTDYGWSTWHKDLGGNYGIWLDKTSARNSSMWDGYTNFSSTVFSPPDLLYGNENGATYINYCFAEVEGYSSFGSYTGNGSADGPFVYTGFRPAWILFKNATASESWQLLDNTRNSFNVANSVLFPNSSSAEVTTVSVNTDFLSNGFKCRAGSGNTNDSGQTYIYMAFAENPFKNANAR